MQNRVILISLRAAAMILIATGLNDVLAGALPRYEPLWLYLAAVALVALLDGVVLGSVTAILAVAFYALLFMPRADAFSPRIAVPLGAALGTAIVASMIRGFVRSRRRRPDAFYAPAAPPLLETSNAAKVSDNAEVLAAIDELRAELREAVSGLTAARNREEELEQRARSYAAEREVIELRARQFENERDWALKVAEEAKSRADRERALRTAAENLLAEARDESSTMAGRVAELELSVNEAERARTEAAARIAELQRTLADSERKSAEATVASHTRAAQETQRAEQAVARVAELDGALAKERATRERLEQERTEAIARMADLERTSAEATVVAHTRAAQETQRAEEALARVAELEAALAEERAARERLESEAAQFDTKLQTIASHLAADHEADLGQAVADREEARAEARRLRGRVTELEGAVARVAELETALATERSDLTARITDLETALAEERATRERLESEAAQFDMKLQTIASHLAADHEADLGQAVADREEARAEARRLRGRVTELETTVARLESEAAQFDTRLQTIVTHLASDHEADLGQALSDKEEARAEARSLSMKLTTLQRKFDEERQAHQALETLLTETRAAAQAEIDRLRAAPSPAPRPRVLIVHPDAELRGNASATLERAGYDVVGAADGLEALRVAIARQPEVVIAEGSMPKMDGRELCQLLKSQEKTAHIRVILLMRAGDDAPRGELSPDEILRKPVPVETLKSTLANLLARPAVSS